MTKTKLTVHPAADVFPMLPEDELNELAADIKSNGLREPIKISNGVLIDGRNRLRACEIAGVEPKFEELNGIDPVTYILSVNINRRHLSKGQRAMATAMVHPEPEKRGGGNKSVLRTEFGSHLSHARIVLATMPELAAQVRDGVVSLNEVYQKAQENRKAIEQQAKGKDALKEQAPDLADLVDEERMKLQEALAALDERRREERAQRAALFGLLEREEMFLRTFHGEHVERIIRTIKENPTECSISEIRQLAGQLAESWKKLETGLS